jgi:hypothetical protein
MSTKGSIPSSGGPGNREPDKLDRALKAGYMFWLAMTPTTGLVEVTVILPVQDWPNAPKRLDPVCGPIADGALAALDHAVDVAEEHRIEQSQKRKPGGSGR